MGTGFAAMWKYLKASVTAFSLLVCLLLIVFWVRSYDHPIAIKGGILNSPLINARTQNGIVKLSLYRDVADLITPDLKLFPDRKWRVVPLPKDHWSSLQTPWSFGSNRLSHFFFAAPHWFWLTIFATIAVLPWAKWRFSLRTLLIVMTLFAIFFGMIAMSL